MLILTRRPKQTVMIGSNVTVTVVSVKGTQVRLGINAPKNVQVHREEVFERLNQGQRGVLSGAVTATTKAPDALTLTGCDPPVLT